MGSFAALRMTDDAQVDIGSAEYRGTEATEDSERLR
jgi:hypothetical protein